jgi:hypothetical protein
MKWLLAPFLWLIAATLALLVLWRWWRGKTVILRGTWSPQVVRMVAIFLVILGVGVQDSPSAPVPGKIPSNRSDEAVPPQLNERLIEQWLTWHDPRGSWVRLKKDVVLSQTTANRGNRVTRRPSTRFTLRDPLLALLRKDLENTARQRPTEELTVKQLIETVNGIEKVGLYDHWLVAYLWRKTAKVRPEERPLLPLLYARLYQHARVTNTLIRAKAQVKPLTIPPRAWMSKAGPSRYIQLALKSTAADMVAGARKLYATSDAGTWERDGGVMLRLPEGSPPLILHSAGHRYKLEGQATLRLDRLELLETPPGDKPVVIEHETLGRITLPAGRLLSVWDLPEFLPEKAQAQVDKQIEQALSGEEAPAKELEKILPFAHRALREQLEKHPEGKGAPRLRVILGLFDDALMPALTLVQRPPAENQPRGRR